MADNQTERKPDSAQASQFKNYPQLGEKRRQWLREDLGIQSPHDLARSSADEIHAALNARRQRLALEIVEGWIAQANAEVAESAPTPNQSPETEQADSPLEHTSVESLEQPEQRADSPPTSDWQQAAAFIVEYQERVPGESDEYRTHAYQIEADTSQLYGIIDNGAVWPGLEQEQLCQWMAERVTDSDLAEQREEPAEIQRLDAPPTTTVIITQARFFQPANVNKAVVDLAGGQPLNAVLHSNKPFAVEIIFEVQGGQAAVSALDSTSFYGQVFIRNRETRHETHLGNTPLRAFTSARQPYKSLLPVAVLPPGEYQLSILVKFKVTPPIVGHAEIPTLYVI